MSRSNAYPPTLVYFASFGSSAKNIYQLSMAILSAIAFNLSDFDFLVYSDQDTAMGVQKILGDKLASKIIFWRAHHKCADIMTEASWARYDIFDYPHISRYSTILYLDTDVVVSGSFLKLVMEFGQASLCSHPIAAYPEGGSLSIQEGYHYWGKDLFDFYGLTTFEEQTSTFTTGVLLFRNCEAVANMFSVCVKISRKFISDFYEMHSEYPDFFNLCDQPTINFLSIKNRLVNTSLMPAYACNHPADMPLIAHFPGGLGSPHKVQNMNAYIEKYASHFFFLRFFLAGHSPPLSEKQESSEALIVVSDESTRICFDTEFSGISRASKLAKAIIENELLYVSAINFDGRLICAIRNSMGKFLTCELDGTIHFGRDQPFECEEFEFLSRSDSPFHFDIIDYRGNVVLISALVNKYNH